MFEIIDSSAGTVVDKTASLASARRTVDWLQSRTLRPHHLRAARNQARPTSVSPLARAYEAGDVEWVDDMPTPTR